MIADTRNLFNSKINELFPKLKENKDYFDGDEQSKKRVAGTYVYEFGEVNSIEDNKQYFVDSLSLQVSLFYEAKKKAAEVIDAALNDALSLRKAVCRLRYNSIQKVDCTGIKVEPLNEYSDKVLKVNINFNLVVATSY